MKYYRRLDYIRVIACVIVLMYHLNILKGGYLLVCTFFVLSGYLSAMSFLKNNNLTLKSYYINRFKKIYIPLVIVVSLTILIIKSSSIEYLNLKDETLSVLFGYNNFWQLSANLDYFVRNINSPFLHLWYISILMQFELIFPIIFITLKKIDRRINNNISTILLFALTTIITLFFYHASKTSDIMIVYYNTFARSFSIMWGVLLALIHHKYNFRIANLFRGINRLIFILYMIILIILSIFITSTSKNYSIFMIITTFVSVRLIDYATNNISYQKKKNKFIDILSNCSYLIYLVQYPVIFCMNNIKINSIIKVIIIILITFIVSYIINKLINIGKYNRYIKIIKGILFSIIVIILSFILINEKDHKKEIKELEDKLSNNSKLIKKKNEEYFNALNSKKKEWDEILSKMDDEESAIKDGITKLPIVGVGDSVLLGVSLELYKVFPNGYFDGEVSRTILGAEEVLNNLKKQGKLADTLILALANNGDYSDKRNKELMDIVGDRQVYWVNAVGADDPEFNKKFSEFAAGYSNIHIIKWDEVANNHPEYFYADGIHVKGDGIKAYVNAIYNEYAKELKKKEDKLIKERDLELRDKIAFYGNDILKASFKYINNKFNKSVFNVKNYTFKNLYDDIKSKIDNNTLEYKLVFIFDKSITKYDYERIIDLCKDYQVYICNMTNTKFKFNYSNVTIIDFYKELNKHKDYKIDDNNLSKKGSNALANILFKHIKK